MKFGLSSFIRFRQLSTVPNPRRLRRQIQSFYSEEKPAVISNSSQENECTHKDIVKILREKSMFVSSLLKSSEDYIGIANLADTIRKLAEAEGAVQRVINLSLSKREDSESE